MRLLLVVAALCGQEADVPTPQVGEVVPQKAPGGLDEVEQEVEPWTGTFAGGMAEVVRLAASEDTAGALALTDRLLAPDGYQRWRAGLEERGGLTARVVGAFDPPLTWLGLERIPASERAEVRFARGLLQLRQGSVLEAETALELVRADAGPGELRSSAVYTLGLVDLGRGEVLRQSIPEISGEQPPQPGAEEEEAPDPLDLARACYTAAREHFVERLRLDWRHGDTQANVELCVRRLRELDEIEREREQQEEQQDPSDDPSQDGEGEPQDGQEPEPNEEEQDSEQDQDQPMPDEAPEPAESEEEQQAPQEEQEMILTEEQMKQLLEELRRHQEVGDELKEQLQGRRRVDTERDW